MLLSYKCFDDTGKVSLAASRRLVAILIILSDGYFAWSYSKLLVWNMTQYSSVLWLDSDTLVVASLHTLLHHTVTRCGNIAPLGQPSTAVCARLLRPSDPRPGPRLGMVRDCEYYFALERGDQHRPGQGAEGDFSNSGVILLRPGDVCRWLLLLTSPQTRRNASTCSTSSWPRL